MSTPSPSTSPPSFAYRMVLGTAIVLGMVFLSLLVWYAVNVLMLIFAGILLAVLLRSLADWLGDHTALSRHWSLMAVLALIVLVLGGVAWFLAPRVATQIAELSRTVPEALQRVADRLGQYAWGDWLMDQLELGNLRETVPQLVLRATGALYTGVGAIFSFVIVLFIGIYLAWDPLLYTTGILRMVTPKHRPRAQEVLGAVGYTLRWWLLGQLAAMFSVGLMVTIGLWALGVPLALTLGLLAFVLDFVPYVGPILAAVPALLLGFADSPAMGLYVVLLYVVIQQIESMLITPLVHRQTVLLPPVLTVVAQVFLSILVGPIGLLLATPLMAATLVLVKMLYVEDVLGEEIATPEDHLRAEEMPPIPQTRRVDEQETPVPHATKEATPRTKSVEES